MKQKQIIILVIALAVIYFGVKIFASNFAEEKIDEAIIQVEKSVDIKYDEASVDLLGLDTHISDVVISPTNSNAKIKIDEVIIYDVDDKADIPNFLSVSLIGINLNLREFGKNTETIEALGYDEEFLANLNIDYVYDKEKTDLNVKNIGLSIDDVGEINVSLHLGNINLNPKKIANILSPYSKTILYGAEINYEDDSLAEKLIRLGATKGNKDINEFKRSLIQIIDNIIEKKERKSDKEILVEIKQFIEDPDELSFKINPSTPVPLASFMKESLLSFLF